MKTNVIMIVFLWLHTSCFSQPSVARQNCDWYRSVYYKNGTDTITIKASFLDIGTKGDHVVKILSSLAREKKLLYADVQYDISFNLVGCPDKVFGGPYIDGPKMNSKLSGENTTILYGKTMLLTCVFYEGYSQYDHPFFIITDVKFED